MQAEPQRPLAVELRHVDLQRRRARMYHVEETTSLFGERGLVITWGRIGRAPRVRLELFQSEAELTARWRALLARRVAQGYRRCEPQSQVDVWLDGSRKEGRLSCQ